MTTGTRRTTDRDGTEGRRPRAVGRVLLIGLPAVVQVGDDYLNDGRSFHLGLAYMAAVLRDNGCQVEILDCYAEDSSHVRSTSPEGYQEIGLPNDGILARVREFAPDLVGLSIPFSCQHYVAMEVARLIRQALPDVTIVVGGNHVSGLPDKVDRQSVDYIVIGEGEHALLHLVEALRRGDSGEGIPGVIGREFSAFRPARLIEDLDGLPFPAIDLLPLSKVWKSGRRWVNMLATRGCAYDCSFCSIHTVMGWKHRRRSIENILEEIARWRRLYGVQEIYFEDDNLTVAQSWAKDLFREIGRCRYGLRLHARNGLRADTLDVEMLRLMKAAGFHDFMISPETGSQSTLDRVIGKRTNLEDCSRVVNLAREVGIGVNAFFVVGFPEETREDMDRTIQYAKSLRELGCAGFWVSLATPFPGTRLYEQCRRQGLIGEELDYRKLRTVDSALEHPQLSAAEIKSIRNEAMAELAPPRRSVIEQVQRGLRLLCTDRPYFLMKLRYRLGI